MIIKNRLRLSSQVYLNRKCDYSVRVYLNRKYTNITNVPKSQMYNILLLHLSINCVPKTVLSVSPRQEELHNIISTKFSMALTVRYELNLSKTFQIV